MALYFVYIIFWEDTGTDIKLIWIFKGLFEDHSYNLNITT